MRRLCLLLLAAGMSLDGWSNNTEAFVGFAYALDNDTLLYREEHRILYEAGAPQAGEVLYIDADENEMGVKRSRYREPSRPSYEFAFTGLDRDTETVEPSDSGVRVNSVRSGNLDWPPGQAVIDSGFHYFILDHFDQLKAGDTVRLEFLAPTRVSWTSLVIEPESNGNDQLKMQLKPRNRLISLFFDPIRLTYDVPSRRLLEYRGLTNVPKPGGGNYTARIEYQYEDTQP